MMKMRDLLFKNLTSNDKKKRIITSAEIVDRQGVRSTIRRHFVCVAKEMLDKKMEQPSPYLFVVKERNTKERREKFFCRVKGSIYAVCNGKLYLILFMHSLRICLEAIPKDLAKYSEE